MTDWEDHRRGVPGAEDAPSGLQARMAALGDRRSPAMPAGPAAALADRVLVYLRPDKAGAVLPYLDRGRSGMIMAGANPAAAMNFLREAGADFPRLIDPACYESYTATAQAPFSLPADGLYQPTLGEALDRQLRLGVTAALTPTGYIPAGGTDVLSAAARQFGQLDRKDAIFIAPLDVSLLDGPYFARTAAILAGLGRPAAVVLGRQFDPLDQSRKIIPNLRALAADVQLMPIRTDFNALDLVATAPSPPRSAPAASSGTPLTPPRGRCPTGPRRASRLTSHPASWYPNWPAGCAAARSASCSAPGPRWPPAAIAGLRRPAPDRVPAPRAPGSRDRPRGRRVVPLGC